MHKNDEQPLLDEHGEHYAHCGSVQVEGGAHLTVATSCIGHSVGCRVAFSVGDNGASTRFALTEAGARALRHQLDAAIARAGAVNAVRAQQRKADAKGAL